MKAGWNVKPVEYALESVFAINSDHAKDIWKETCSRLIYYSHAQKHLIRLSSGSAKPAIVRSTGVIPRTQKHTVLSH